MKNLFTLVLISYWSIAIVTFGYSAANYNPPYPDQKAIAEVQRVYVALWSGLFWPLYWSWEFFE